MELAGTLLMILIQNFVSISSISHHNKRLIFIYQYDTSNFLNRYSASFSDVISPPFTAIINILYTLWYFMLRRPPRPPCWLNIPRKYFSLWTKISFEFYSLEKYRPLSCLPFTIWELTTNTSEIAWRSLKYRSAATVSSAPPHENNISSILF